MHKNPYQNAGNGIKKTLFFKIFLGSMLPDPLEVLAPSARVGQIRVRPPKIFKPVRLWTLSVRCRTCQRAQTRDPASRFTSFLNITLHAI